MRIKNSKKNRIENTIEKPPSYTAHTDYTLYNVETTLTLFLHENICMKQFLEVV